MPLQGQTVDAPLIALNQSWPASAGPAGRLRQINNAIAKKWMETQSGITLRAEKRDAFVQLPTAVRDPASGAVSSKTVNGGTAMASYGKQLVLAAAGSLFALSEAASCWESPTYIGPTQVLRETPVLNRSSVESMPDAARIGSRTAYVWANAGTTTTWMQIVDDDGTTVAQPFILAGGLSTQVKLLSDGTRFWLLVKDTPGKYQVFAYDTNGVLLGQDTATIGQVGTYFDIAVNTNAANSIVFIQKSGAAGWSIRTITWNGAAVVVSAASTVSAFGCDTSAIAFLRNDTGDHRYYVLTIGGAGPFPLRLWPISDATQTVVAGPWTVGNVAAVADMSGFVTAASSTTATVLVSSLDTTPRPQFNSTAIWTVTGVISGGATVNAQPTKASLTIVSRPLLLGASYYVVAYYHSDPTAAVTGAVAGTTNNTKQSTFFLVNLDVGGNYQVCGSWDRGLAYADWQVTSSGVGYFHLSTPNVDPFGGVHVALAYRATSFTTAVRLALTTGFDTAPLGPWYNIPENTVGIKDVSLGPDSGQPFEFAGELFIPGPQANTFIGSAFVESNFTLIPEVTSLTPGGGGSLLNGQVYQYVVVAEWTDNNGNRVRAQVGPPYNVSTAGGGNNQVTIVGTMLHVSQKSNIMISAYRTVFTGASPVTSVDHYKVTNDLAPTYNSDGSATFTIVDGMLDAVAAANDKVYTDKGYLDRFPCPPFSVGTGGAGRAFVVGYDGAIWFSGEKTEGDALWFSPFQRIPMPTTERVAALAVLDNYLIIFGERESVYALPISQLPDATGQGPTPRPTLLPVSHGCTGFAVTYSDGIMFSSTQGGLWVITRDLKDVFVGRDVKAELEPPGIGFAAPRVVGMAVDQNQRLGVLLSNQKLLVYDSVVRTWYTWQTAPAGSLLATHKGRFVLADPNRGVWRQSPGIYVEDGAGIITTVEAVFHLAGIRKLSRIWDMQTQGQYVDVHSMTVTGTFDDEYSSVVETYGPFVADPANLAYIYQLPPKVEECASVTLKFQDSYPSGGTAGFALDGVSFEVAMEKGLGQVTAARRISPT